MSTASLLTITSLHHLTCDSILLAFCHHVTDIGIPIGTVQLHVRIYHSHSHTHTLSLSFSRAHTLQGGEFHLTWSPSDLTQQDVASLYLAQTDSWAMVDQFGTYCYHYCYHSGTSVVS